MSVSLQIAAALNVYATPCAFPAGAETARISLPAGQLSLGLAAVDSIGCSLYRLTLATNHLAGASIARLRMVSDNLANRVRYLLEPIRPIETDTESATVQLRSSPPLQRDSQTAYYELFVRRGGEIALVRFEKEPGQVREETMFSLTREVLIRLVDDVCEASAFGQ